LAVAYAYNSTVGLEAVALCETEKGAVDEFQALISNAVSPGISSRTYLIVERLA
jgi:hypothetical protein